MTLAYYAKEREAVKASFPDLVAAPCSFADAEILIRRLAKENDVWIRAITPTSGRNRSMWLPTERRIKLNVGLDLDHDSLSWRTAIHEFAHALDEKLRPHSGRWHDSTFLDLVLDLCQIVNARGWYFSIPEERKTAERIEDQQRQDRDAARTVRDAIRNAPEAVRARKIEKRRAQIARLESKIKSLSTRLKSARRSLTALERAASKEKGVES